MTNPDEPQFCTYCAAPLKAGAPFCAECGREVPVHVDHTLSSTPPSEPCRFCGAPTEPDDRFCPVCGHAAPRRVVSAVVSAGDRAQRSPRPDDGLPRWIALIAVLVALLAGGALGLEAIGFLGAAATPSPAASLGSVVVITPGPTLELATLAPLPSASPAVPSESPSPSAPTFDPFASPSPGLASESPALASPSFGFPSPSPSLASPSPPLGPRTIVVGLTKTDPPAKGNFRVTLKQIDVLADGTMQFSFHVKNVGKVNDCVKLNSDGLDDFLVDSAGSRYVPTGWGTASGPLPFDQCGPPRLRPGDTWDYVDLFPALFDPSLTFDLTIYHGDLIFSGLSIAP